MKKLLIALAIFLLIAQACAKQVVIRPNISGAKEKEEKGGDYLLIYIIIGVILLGIGLILFIRWIW